MSERTRSSHWLPPVLGALALSFAACRSTPPEPEPAPATATPEAPTAVPPAPAETAPASAAPVASASAEAVASAQAAPEASAAPAASASAASTVRYVKPVAPIRVSPDDPIAGKFTLEDATKGLPKEGTLFAEIQTDLGKLSCELYDDRAPITVANFIGLARGLRPFKTADGKWQKKPGYDGTVFHRVIKGFMIQGGDPEGTGRGEPGYVIPDEIWEGAKHDERGLLCMANRGPNTNGMQFFIMDGKAAHLDGGYTVFGKCGPDEVIEKLASVEVQGDRALKPVKMTKVTIKRKAAAAAASSAKPPGAKPLTSSAPAAAAPKAAAPAAAAPATPAPAASP